MKFFVLIWNFLQLKVILTLSIFSRFFSNRILKTLFQNVASHRSNFRFFNELFMAQYILYGQFLIDENSRLFSTELDFSYRVLLMIKQKMFFLSTLTRCLKKTFFLKEIQTKRGQFNLVKKQHKSRWFFQSSEMVLLRF